MLLPTLSSLAVLAELFFLIFFSPIFLHFLPFPFVLSFLHCSFLPLFPSPLLSSSFSVLSLYSTNFSFLPRSPSFFLFPQLSLSSCSPCFPAALQPLSQAIRQTSTSINLYNRAENFSSKLCRKGDILCQPSYAIPKDSTLRS